ncbi:hypothetical protein AK812_SmicGene39860 [Symbiodinium microadriaticum]|uniref:Apple domain-containing protein n=1 Tax=Symbiodinium microadriaticum TaxID=2951 RepID=A0A1Q9CA76_SYMMI|nr:hypothetical protein AK812_SmicGene39860 [Symbiodinium microadriaticum]
MNCNFLTTTTHTQPPLLSDVWSSRKDLNCLVSAGGAQTASGRDYLGVLPKEACIKECAHQKGCDAALIQDFGRVGNCWLRSNVFLDHCSRAPGFTVWIRVQKGTRHGSDTEPSHTSDEEVAAKESNKSTGRRGLAPAEF